MSTNSICQSHRPVITKSDTLNNRFFNNKFVKKVGNFTCSFLSSACRALINTRTI
jgi:hypothetical protein